jgi:hypothetical protein
MCLIRFQSLKLLTILIYPMLSFNKITAFICLSNDKKLLTNRIKNMASLAVSHAAMYSASVNNRATHYCRFKLYEMGEPYIINTYLIINLLIIGLSPQSKSTYIHIVEKWDVWPRGPRLQGEDRGKAGARGSNKITE